LELVVGRCRREAQVIELEDRTVMLSGNVEEQYEQWRELLADIYRAEVGMLELPAAQTTP